MVNIEGIKCYRVPVQIKRHGVTKKSGNDARIVVQSAG